MLSPGVLAWILIILLILIAAPLLGALTTNTSIVGLTSIWIALLALLVIAAVLSIVRFAARRNKNHHRAA